MIGRMSTKLEGEEHSFSVELLHSKLNKVVKQHYAL